MSLHYRVKLEMLIGHVQYHWVVTGRNSRIYFTSIMASKFARFLIQLITAYANIARKGVQKYASLI